MTNNQDNSLFRKVVSNDFIISWLILILLTLLSVYISDIFQQRKVFVFTVLAIVFIKGQQIVDVFMELKHAPRKWRLLLLSYVLLIPMIISLIYLI